MENSLVFFITFLCASSLIATSSLSCQRPKWNLKICQIKNSSVLVKFEREVGKTWIHEGENVILLQLINLMIAPQEENSFEIIEAEDLGRIPKLFALSLNNTKIRGSSPFRDQRYLRTVQLVNNQFQEFPREFFQGIPDVRFLGIQKQNIGGIYRSSFSNISERLEKFYFQANQLRIIGPNTFSKFTILETLDLTSNKLEVLKATMFSGLDGLETLSLDCNRINRIDPQTFSALRNLKILNLANNLLTTLGSALFKPLRYLKSLQLSSNKIEKILPGTFDGLIYLRKLFLTGNKFHVPETFFADLRGLEILKVYGRDFQSSDRCDVLEPMDPPRSIPMIDPDITGYGSIVNRFLIPESEYLFSSGEKSYYN
ncbi:phospholipase A2 inhibitor [Fopius arisanus]|uniref:Phospholipase A2 inhibitor n=1 Tax=Fopius arisanus TaxID=64838 RepID=A0A9R1U328_9HYME|nr:PREDICTED: phospholipase A2 inhibitor [Fopius arisanus]